MTKKKGFDVTEHKLVPEHTILSDEESQELLNKYDIEAHQLPKISSKDPVAKAIGAETGQIVKINRESPTKGKAVVYRFVI